jgi:hypothetical protein
MVKLKLLYLVLIHCCIANVSVAQQSELLSCAETKLIFPQSSTVHVASFEKPSIAYPPASRDFKKLAINTSIFIGSSVMVFGVLSLFPEDVSGWKKNEIQTRSLFERWSEHVKSGPVSDYDNMFFNYVTHPYAGAVYYMTARSCGYKGFECFLYSAAMSTLFWEYGVEAFAEVPSSQDLLITPITGAVIGEIFFGVKKDIMNHDKRVLGSKLLGAMTLLFLDPFNTILDGAGYKQKVSTQLSFLPAPLHDGTNKSGLQLNFAVHF